MSSQVRTAGRPAALPTMSYHLPVSHGWAVLPDATREFGGLTSVPDGFRARLFIGDARDIDEYTARTLAAVLAHCAGYRVHGTDPHGLGAVTGTLHALLGR